MSDSDEQRVSEWQKRAQAECKTASLDDLDWHTPDRWWDLENFPHATWYGIDAVGLYSHEREAQPPTDWAARYVST